jgi:CheY-like chemotaxis protein
METKMYNILIVDFSLYKESLKKIFLENGYGVVLCESAFDAMAKLKAIDFDLVVSEIELPGDNAFDLYNYITRNYPYIPTIMTTEKNMDFFFDRIFQEGIGNVLCKPLKKEEILNLAEKLITKKNIFGLENYIKDISGHNKIRINSSKQIKKAVETVMDAIEGWGFQIENKMSLTLVLNEMGVNAVYHPHGHTREKEARLPVRLGENEYVDIFFCKSGNKFGIAIDDYKGKLNKEIILGSISRVIEQGQLIQRAADEGRDITDLVSETGRGIDLLRKLFADCYFIIKKDVRTEIILIFDYGFREDNSEFYSSLKIIEDFDS